MYLQSLRKDIIETEKLLAQISTGAMEQQYVVKSTGNNVNNMLNPKLKGHVSVDKPNDKFDSMDMKVHLTLKSKKKPRSRSLSRHDEPSRPRKEHSSKTTEASKQTCHSTGKIYSQHGHRSKRWSEILHQNNEIPHSQSSRNRSRPMSPMESHNYASATVQNKYGENCHKVNVGSKDGTTDVLSHLNPIRTLNFLICELQKIISPQGKQEHAILSVAEKLILQISHQHSISQANHELHGHASSRDQISRTTYEIMRKERDSLQKELAEKSHSHITLERKCARLEAKLNRVCAERNEVREASEKLVAEQQALLAHTQTNMMHYHVRPDISSKHEVAHLQEELRRAQDHITHLQANIQKLEDQYHAKMKVVLDILHDGFDFTKNDSAHISEVVGEPPANFPDSPILESKSDTLKLNLPNLESKIEDLFSVQPPPLTSQTNNKFSVEDYINDLMKKSGLLREEQITLFQSFQSIPELSPDK